MFRATRPTVHPDQKKLYNALIGELDYYKRLLPLVLDPDRILENLVEINFTTNDEKKTKIDDFSSDRKINNFLNFISNKYSKDLSTVIAALEKCQQYQVSKVIVKIQLLINRIWSNTENSLSTKTLYDLRMRLNIDVLHNDQVTELNLFNWSTAFNIQHNQITSYNYSRKTRISWASVDDTESTVCEYKRNKKLLIYFSGVKVRSTYCSLVRSNLLINCNKRLH